MKKILSAILMLSTIPAFATGVPSTETTADCDKPTLNTYTGTSNLVADWRANTIALHWYDGDTELTVPTASQSCVYDGILTPPSTIPTKTGYTFKGWRVKQAAGCSLSGLNPSISADWDATHARWKPLVADGWSMAEDFGTENSSDLNPGEWAITFSYGTVKGMAKCSSTGGSWATPGTPSDTNGRYCWCKATNYTPNGGNQCNVSSSSWVFNDDPDDAVGCADDCASNCAGVVQFDFDFRRAVFGAQ